MIMLDACDPPHLVRYAKYIKTLAQTYGQECWALIYQSEARFRREHLVRLRRNQTAAKEAAIAAGGNTDYDSARPWNTVFKIATAEYSYWHESVETPCLMIISNARKVGHFLDGDATVAASADAHMATQHTPYMEVGVASGSAIQVANRPAQRRGAAAPAPHADEPPTKKPKAQGKRPLASSEPAHNVSNGQFTTNRRNVKICTQFQSGACTRKRCNAAHQCAICLSPAHGATHPKPCNAGPPPAQLAAHNSKGGWWRQGL